MRVFLGPIDIAGQARLTAIELEKRGHYARFFNGHDSYLGYQHEDGEEYSLKELPSLNDFNVFDVFFGAFVPMAGRSAFPDSLRFVHHFCGSDVRQLDVAKEQNPFAVVKGKDRSEKIREHLKNLATLTDHCTIMDEELRPHVAPFFKNVHIVPRMIDVYKFNPSYNGHKKLTVVHASTHGQVKGTPNIVAAVDEIKRGMDFDFWLVSGMRHDKAMKLYQESDVVVCQLNLDSYGILAIEAMAMGKLVITRLSDGMRKTYPEDPPIISADPTNVKEVLADVLSWPADVRAEVGQWGRSYVEKYHSTRAVMPKLLEVYKLL